MKDFVGLIQEFILVYSHGEREALKFQAAELCGPICIFPENSHASNLQQCKPNWETVTSSRVGHEKVLNFSVKWDSRGRMSMERGDRVNRIKGGRQLHFSSRASFPYLLLLLLLSRFNPVRLCATPQTAAHQAPLSLGCSRQEHWSGLPFPSPVHESESEVAQQCPTLRDSMECSPPGSSIHGIFQARVLEWGAIVFSGFHSYQHPYPWVGFFQANSCNLLWLLRYWDESNYNLAEACKTFAFWDLPSCCWQLFYHHVIKLGLASQKMKGYLKRVHTCLNHLGLLSCGPRHMCETILDHLTPTKMIQTRIISQSTHRITGNNKYFALSLQIQSSFFHNKS